MEGGIFKFYTDSTEELLELFSHINKLPKKTKKSIEEMASVTGVGIDSPQLLENLIRIYPLTGKIMGFTAPTESKGCIGGIRFTYKRMDYSVSYDVPSWIEKP